MLYTLGSRSVSRHPTAYVAPNASVIGSVILAEEASVWFGAVLRGDAERIEIGPQSNIQDGCVGHADPGYPLILGEKVTVGHMAMLHGCHLEGHCLVGIGAVILNGAKIGRDCIIGAGTLITGGKEIPPGKLVLGSPGKVIRDVTEHELEMIHEGWTHYVDRGREFAAHLREQP